MRSSVAKKVDSEVEHASVPPSPTATREALHNPAGGVRRKFRRTPGVVAEMPPRAAWSLPASRSGIFRLSAYCARPCLASTLLKPAGTSKSELSTALEENEAISVVISSSDPEADPDPPLDC